MQPPCAVKRRGRRSGGIPTLLIALCLTTGCATERETPVTGPGASALELFEVAGLPERSPERLEALFELGQDDRRRAELGDALDRVAQARRPQIILVETMAESGKTAIDLTAELEGGGFAEFSVQLQGAGEEWKIVWFQGPGIDWPRQRRPRGDGLTTSTPP
jgi:hypothetical protein